jgi:hypothetical protein
MYKLSLFKLSLFKLTGRLEFLLGANGQPGSMAIGNTLMLLMKPPNTQGGMPLSFPHRALPKWAIDFLHGAKVLPPLMPRVLKPL